MDTYVENEFSLKWERLLEDGGHSLIKHKQISYSMELYSIILYIGFFFLMKVRLRQKTLPLKFHCI